MICEVDLLRARLRGKPEHVERLLARHARAAVAAPLHGGPRHAGRLLLELRSRLLHIGAQHRDGLPHQLRIHRLARVREGVSRTAKMLRAGCKGRPRGVKRAEQHAPARRRLHEHRQHESGEHHRRRPAVGGDEPGQHSQRERRQREQRPSSRIDDGAWIGVEDKAAHLDRGHEQRERKRRVGDHGQIHVVLPADQCLIASMPLAAIHVAIEAADADKPIP